jgi:hypothetical protein
VGRPATPESLRVDRHLEEALIHGPDSLHLAGLFGDDVRYAEATRLSWRPLRKRPNNRDTIES